MSRIIATNEIKEEFDGVLETPLAEFPFDFDVPTSESVHELKAAAEVHCSTSTSAAASNLLDQVVSHNAQSYQVKREIEDENEVTLKNVVDKAAQTNEETGDCVKLEIEEDGEMIHIKKEEEEDGEVTRVIDIETLTQDSQSGAGADGETTQLMDCVKLEIKEEFDYGHEIEIKQEEDETTNNEVKFEIKEEEEEEVMDTARQPYQQIADCVKLEIKEEFDDGQMLDIKKEEEEGENEETDEVVEHNEGGDEMNPNSATDIDTLFDRSMGDEIEFGEPTRTYHELMPVSNQTHNADTSLANASTSISNEPQSNLTDREDENEDQGDPNPQYQFNDAETNINNGGMMQIDEEEKVGDGQTRVTDFEELAANEGDNGESSSVDAEIGTTPVHLTRQSQANKKKSARHDKRKLKVPQARNELSDRDNQHVNDEEKAQIDEVSSRRVKRPKMDTTRPNLGQPNRQLQCSHCPKSFDRNSKLQAHLLVHSGERPFACDQCGKRFSQAGNLARHQLTHQNIKRFQCPECEKQFTLKCNLDSHLVLHSGERPFECRHCEKSFTTSDTRNSHEQAIHLHVKSYRCKQCAHTATQRSAIITHIRMVHFGLPQTIKEQRSLNIVDDRDPRELLEKV